MANEQETMGTPSEQELDAQIQAIYGRTAVSNLGEDLTPLNLQSDPDRTLQMQNYQQQIDLPIFQSSIDSMAWNDFLVGGLREDGQHVLADEISNQSYSGNRPILPGDIPAREFHPIAEGVRTHWREMRQGISLQAAQTAVDGVGFFRKTVARIFGSDATQVAIGGVEPLARAQQVLYGALRGEGWAALSRLFPSVVLEDRTDPETGAPVETSPWAATMDVIWAKMRGDDKEYYDNMALLREVNTAYAESELVEFKDVMDSVVGYENMDSFYEDMYDAGPLGKIGLATMAAAYTVAEIFVDPLTIFDFAPTSIVRGGKNLASTATQAQLATKVARKTRRLPDVIEARNVAKKHLNAAHAEYKARPTPEAATNLQNAMKLLAEMEDEVDVLRRKNPGGNEFDTVNLTNPARRNPSTISTTDVKITQDAIPGTGNSWERGIRADSQNGLVVYPEWVTDPINAFMSTRGRDLQMTSIGNIGNTDHVQMRQAIEIMAEKLGIRVIPFQSTKYKDKTLKLNGAYVEGARTIFLNTTRGSEHGLLTTFLHEAQHHLFYTHFGNAAKSDLVQGMLDAGFDFSKYHEALSHLDYNLGGTLALADEFTARSVTQMATNPEFWDTLRRLDPETFDTLARSSMDLATDALHTIDCVEGRIPRKWMPNDPRVQEFADANTYWGKHTQQVLSGIERAYAADPVLYERHLASLRTNIDNAIEKMVRDRENLQAAGKKTPLLDKEIERAQAHANRIDTYGARAQIAGLQWKQESLRARSVDEVFELVQDERRAAAIRSTREMQPNQQPTWFKEGDEWKEGSFVQQDLFDDGNQLADRLANGPDDAEYAAEGLARMTHGASEDDITMRLQAIPERMAETGSRIVPGTKMGMIDMDRIHKTLYAAKKKAKARGLELWEYDSGAAFMDEALNALKVESPPKVPKKKKGYATLEEYRANAPKKGKKYRDVPYDEAWLPKKRPRTEDLVANGWWDNHQASNFDRIAGGLYPHTWQIKFPAMLRAGVMFMREPMRVLEIVDPGKSWPLLRSAMHNAENETTRLKSVFDGAMQEFGALNVRDRGRLAKLIRTNTKEKVEVNKALSEKLFDILNTSTSSEKYAELTADLTGAQRKAVADIRHELNLIADRLGITGSDTFIDGYIHHAFDASLYARGAMPPEHAGMSRSGNVFLGALLKRNGEQGFTRDAVGALEVYSRGVSRKLHLEPALQRFHDRAKWTMKYGAPENKFFGKYADLLIAQLRGEPSYMGGLVDSAAGAIAAAAGKTYVPGTVSRKVMAVNSLIYSSLLAGNRRYPIMSIATGLATTGAKYGMFRTLKGMFKMATPEGQILFKHMQGDKQWGRIFESDLMTNFTEKFTKFAAETRLLGTVSTTDTENFIRGMTFWASIDEVLTKLGHTDIRMADEAGLLEEVLFNAMRTTEEVNHFFGVGSKPPIFSKISKSGSALGSQFLSFPFKQSEQLLAMGKDDPGQIARFIMLSGWISRVGAQELGIDLQDYVGIDDSVPHITGMESPGVALLASMAKMIGTMTALGDGHASAEEATASVNDFLQAGEVVIPFLRLAREGAQMLEMDATGRKSTPGLGYGRDVKAEYFSLGDRMSVPLPTGAKGDRSEVLGIATGARTIEETLQQNARKEVRHAVNQAAIERLSLVEDAKHAMDSGNWEEVRKQLKRMSDMGLPIGNFNTALEQKNAVNIMDWYIIEMRRNPQLVHKLIPILQENGILGEQDAQRQ